MKRVLIVAAVMAVASLVVASAAQAELRVGKNYRLNSDAEPFRQKDQIGLAVNPNNPQHVVAVNIEYVNERGCEGTRSLDGGATWSAADTFDVPAAFAAAPPAGTPPRSSCRIPDHLADELMQSVVFGSGMNVYTAFVTAKETLGGGAEQAGTVFVARSADGGLTWNTSTVAMPGGASSGVGPNYELPTIGVQPGAGPGNQDRLYIAARETSPFFETGGDIMMVRSDNGGTTFTAPVRVEPAGQAAAGGQDTASQPVVLDDGSVVVAWRTAGITGDVNVARSTTQGDTWSPAVKVAGVSNNAANTANPPGPSPSTGSTFPRLTVDRSATPDRLYIVYNQGAAPPTGPFAGSDHFIPPDSDVYFQRSIDGTGAQWSTPKLINEATPKPGLESPANPASYGMVTQTRHPNVTVAPNGRVDIVWEDRRHWYRGCIHTHVACDEARLGDTYYSFSTNGGTDFSPNRRISDRSHNNDVGSDYRFGVAWAFGPVSVPLANNELLVAWMDPRQGNWDNDNLDISLAKVNHNGPAAIPQETVPRPSDPAGLSVALSRHAYPGGGEGLLESTFATRNGTRVVIAPQNDIPATLAASVLARANLSQVLLSPSGGLPASVKAEVTRMNPAGAYVVGDTAALSDQVIQDLEDAGVPNGAGEIERIGSANDAEMAGAIATELDRRTQAQKDANSPPAFNAAVLVNPASPDASAVAGLASARRLPILFTDPNPSVATLPAATTQALNDLDIDKVLVVGGPQWVNATIFSALSADAPERLGGANQYETSEAVIAESLDRGLPANVTYVANGGSPIDGALLGSTVGRATGLLMLAPAPVAGSAPGIAAGQNLAGAIDRLILLQPAQAGGGGGVPQYPGPGGGAAPAFAGCPSGSANVILGGPGNDVRNGTPAGDRIFVGTGNDVVDGLAGNDCIDLGPGNDRGQGGLGNDLILGGTGADRVSGSSGNDTIRGNSGNDRINGGLGNDRLHGLAGRDRISGSRGRDRINGGSSADTISAGSSGDRVAGDAGSDRINGNSGNDRISGNSGNDRLRGSTGRDRISGGSGRDRIAARDGQRDRINCGSGNDRVSADRIDIVSGNCESVSRAGASAASSAANSLGLPVLVGGAYVALLGWRRRRNTGPDKRWELA